MAYRTGPVLSESFEDIRADYDAAKSSRLRRRRTGINPSGSGADYHYRNESDYLRLMEEARDMCRNDVIIGSTIDRAATNIIQGGFTPSVNSGDKSLNKDMVDAWWEWAYDADACDASGEHCFADIEWLTCRQMLCDGDLWHLLLADGRMQMIEGHRVRTPYNTKRNVVHGVLLDDLRRHVEAWITNDDINPSSALSRVGDVTAYPIRDKDGYRQVLQAYDPKRSSQTRGVTALAPIFDYANMFGDIGFAKLVQQQVAACITFFQERGSEWVPGPNSGASTATTVSQVDGSTRSVMSMTPGQVLKGDIGETFKGFSPDVPSEGWFQHMKLILSLIGINVGMPLVMVLMDASETNFSGWRGAVDQAKMGFRRLQQGIGRRVHKPTWDWRARQLMASDRVLRSRVEAKGTPLNPFNAEFAFPAWPYIDPLKDAQADLLMVKNALTSQRRRVAARDETDWETLSTEIVDDNGVAIIKAKAKARAINADIADEAERVHWRELISLPMPEGMQMVNVE